MQEIHASQVRPPFYRDERWLGIFSQIFVVAVVLGLGLFFYNNMITGLREKHTVAISFSFLSQTAGFDIGESLIEYSREKTYARAFVVGLLNTFQVAFLGIIFATALGVVIGVMRLSHKLPDQPYRRRLHRNLSQHPPPCPAHLLGAGSLP